MWGLQREKLKEKSSGKRLWTRHGRRLIDDRNRREK